jgi:hypothetical protein
MVLLFCDYETKKMTNSYVGEVEDISVHEAGRSKV